VLQADQTAIFTVMTTANVTAFSYQVRYIVIYFPSSVLQDLLLY